NPTCDQDAEGEDRARGKALAKEKSNKKSFKWRDECVLTLCEARQKYLKEFGDPTKVTGNSAKVPVPFMTMMDPLDDETKANWQITAPTVKILQSRFATLRNTVNNYKSELDRSGVGMKDPRRFTTNMSVSGEDSRSRRAGRVARGTHVTRRTPICVRGVGEGWLMQLDELPFHADTIGKERMIDMRGPPAHLHREKINIKRKRVVDIDVEVAAVADGGEETQSGDVTLSGSGDDYDDCGLEDQVVGEEDPNAEGEEDDWWGHDENADPGKLILHRLPSAGSSPLPLLPSISIEESLFKPASSTTTPAPAPQAPRDHPSVPQAPPRCRDPRRQKAHVSKEDVVNVFATSPDNRQTKKKNQDAYKGPVKTEVGSSSPAANVKVVPIRVKTRTPGKTAAVAAVGAEATEQIIAWLNMSTDKEAE
ncbi:hypothetical protein BDK51DRAFT_47826, partial [Blyttiomyces helicus]